MRQPGSYFDGVIEWPSEAAYVERLEEPAQPHDRPEARAALRPPSPPYGPGSRVASRRGARGTVDRVTGFSWGWWYAIRWDDGSIGNLDDQFLTPASAHDGTVPQTGDSP